ncbi:regulator [Clostridium rectalis]|uniref:regulator n=1 Tax=Clostridium rectalis TaxID=2040295 RepID=UPI000F62F3FE|nr:regulator [Clostridium rectalis]
MKKYELVIENPTDAFILDKEENKIVALCNTKRPDLEFNKLETLIEKANKNIKQLFQLGDIAYMIDEDYRFFESEVYRIELDNGKYYYTADDCDFEDGDIGNWVFKSEIERELHLEALM